MKKTLIRNAKAVVTCDAADSVLHDVDILVFDGKIAEIGMDIVCDDCDIIDAHDMFVYPGLINTHHHFFQAFVRNLMSLDVINMTLVEWLDAAYRIFYRIDADVIYYASLTAMADLIKHGCTCTFDHQYCYTPFTGTAAIDRQMEAAELLGMRFHAGRGTNTLPRSKGSTMPDEMCETTDDYLKDCERLIQKYHDPEPFSMRRIVMAPCQPINCFRETFTETVKMARKHHVFMHTHIGEGENEEMVARWGKRSVEWCQNAGFVGPDVWFAHCYELQPDEYHIMASTGTSIAHCPVPMALCGRRILNLKEVCGAGINVSLAVDGCSGNDGSSMLDTMRVGFLLQTLYSITRGGCVSPYDILKMSTVNGAKVLGRPELGSLEVGKAADLFMIDMGKLELAGTLHDPKSLLPRVGVTGDVALTMINGKIVFKDGHLTSVDERKLAEEGEKVCTRVLREPCHNAFYYRAARWRQP